MEVVGLQFPQFLSDLLEEYPERLVVSFPIDYLLWKLETNFFKHLFPIFVRLPLEKI